MGGVVNWLLCATFEVFFRSSVNVFGLITGYLYVRRHNYSYLAIVRIIFEVLFYSILITLFVKILQPDWIKGKKSFIEALFPFGTRLWYATAYIFVFCMIPYLNCFIENCDKKTYSSLLIVLFVLLSFFTTFGIKDYFYINNGYSCFWLVYMYLIGAYIKQFAMKIRKKLIFIFYSITIFLLFGIIAINYFFNNQLVSKITARFQDYSSPFILLNSIFIFLLLKDIKIENSALKKFFSYISSSSFAVYVVHAHGLVLDNFLYILLPSKLLYNPFCFLGIGLSVVFTICLGCIILDKVRLFIERCTGFILLEQKISDYINNKLL